MHAMSLFFDDLPGSAVLLACAAPAVLLALVFWHRWHHLGYGQV